jgi:hypothetical protein
MGQQQLAYQKAPFYPNYGQYPNPRYPSNPFMPENPSFPYKAPYYPEPYAFNQYQSI